MLRKLNKTNKGFTIIEVMIVLAIAGLIMAIVFLAVPALQRNQRNNARKSDVNRIASSVISFYANTGSTPATTADVTTIRNDVGSFGQYNSATCATAGSPQNNTICITVPTAAVAALPTTIDAVNIVTKSNCNGSATTYTGNVRNVAIQYTLETATASAPYCQDVQ